VTIARDQSGSGKGLPGNAFEIESAQRELEVDQLTDSVERCEVQLDDAHGAVTQAMIEGKPLEPVMMAYRQLAAKADKDFRRLNELTGWYA